MEQFPNGLQKGIVANFTIQIKYVVNSFFFYRTKNGTAAQIAPSTYKALHTNDYYFGNDPLRTAVFSSFILPKGSPLEV